MHTHQSLFEIVYYRDDNEHRKMRKPQQICPTRVIKVVLIYVFCSFRILIFRVALSEPVCED